MKRRLASWLEPARIVPKMAPGSSQSAWCPLFGRSSPGGGEGGKEGESVGGRGKGVKRVSTERGKEEEEEEWEWEEEEWRRSEEEEEWRSGGVGGERGGQVSAVTW